MSKFRPELKRSLFLGAIITTLGIVMTTSIKQNFGSLGLVFVAIGGLLFILSMRRSKQNQEDEEKKKED